jgi:DNA-binding FrmR family transcriptional regulator
VTHTHDTELINRLKRANGHLATIVKMIEEDRDALDIAQQLQAVVGALDKARSTLVAHHIEHHLEDAVGPLSKEAREKLARLSSLAKYL